MYRFPRVAEKQWSIAWHKTGPKQEADSGVIEVVGGAGVTAPLRSRLGYGKHTQLGYGKRMRLGFEKRIRIGWWCGSDGGEV